MNLTARRRLLAVARGEEPPDLVIVGGEVANVYSGEWLAANVEVAEGRIAYVGPRPPLVGARTRVVQAEGRPVVPGYIEPHCHPWVVYSPLALLERALADGTTTLVFDNLFFFVLLGPQGWRRLADRLREAPADVRWVVRLHPQWPYQGEEEDFAWERLRDLLAAPDVVGSGEVTRWPAVCQGDSHLLDALGAVRASGKRADGHMAGASYDRLCGLAAAGLDADHEAITGPQALDRLRLGLWVMLRFSSLRPDLPELVRFLCQAGVHTHRLLLTTDGAAPDFYQQRGVVAGALEEAVRTGMDPMAALQAATLNAATFLGLDGELGGIAPGRRAHLLLLPSRTGFRPELVLVDGRVVARDGRLVAPLPEVDWAGLGLRLPFAPPRRFEDPALYHLPADRGGLPGMRLVNAVITRSMDDNTPRVAAEAHSSGREEPILAVLCDRMGRWMAKARLAGLMPGLEGLATTFTTSTQLLVLGRDPASMAAAAGEVARLGGGFALAEGGSVVWGAALPVGGMMTEGPFDEAVRIERELGEHARRAGYRFHDILYTLLFLTCDFLPDLRLTPRGVMEVKSGRVVYPAQPMPGA